MNGIAGTTTLDFEICLEDSVTPAICIASPSLLPELFSYSIYPHCARSAPIGMTGIRKIPPIEEYLITSAASYSIISMSPSERTVSAAPLRFPAASPFVVGSVLLAFQ